MPASRRAVLPLLAVLVLLGGCARPETAALARPAIVTQAAGGGQAYEAYAGEVHAREEPSLGFRIAGKISRRLVDAGAHVQSGQALAELDAADVRLGSDASAAQLAAAQSDLALARAELQRYRELADRQLVSRSLFETRQAAFRAAQSRVQQANAQAAASGNQVSYAVLRAPRTGVISQRLAEAGQVVASGQPVFVLAVDGEREVLISVPEQSLGRFQRGRDLSVELWTAPGKRFPGKLRELSPAADPVTRTYAARVSFDPQATAVDLGQSARVYAPDAAGAAMRLPLSALTQKQGRPAVWVVDPRSARVHLTPVVIGAFAEDGVPVQSGISSTDWVVAAGAHLLLEGEKITAIDRNNRPVALATADAPVASTTR